MEAKNIIGGILIVVLAYFIFSYVATGSILSNPLQSKFYIKTTIKIKKVSIPPIYTYYYFDPSYLTVEATSSKFFSIEPYSLINHESNVVLKVDVQTPNGELIEKSVSLSYSSDGYKTYYFTIPADEKGSYTFSVQACGNWYGMQRCITKTGSYVVS